MKGLSLVAVAVVLLAMVAAGCSKSDAQKTENAVPAVPAAPAPVAKAASFNTSDKNILTNGNMLVAAKKIIDEPNVSLADRAEVTSASKLSKSPYSSIGKVCKLTGAVYKVEELPPGQSMNGRWSELLLMVENPNSPLGATSVDFMYSGDVSEVNSGDIVTCYGYFIGTFESENSVGGKVEAITMVGNAIKHRR